jgi:sporulation protein YlmC with PRC-barrel domain
MNYPTQNAPQESAVRAPNLNQAAPMLLSSSTITGDDVYNLKNEKLGDIKDIMLDVTDGKVCYAVLSFGGFLGLGDKLFAVPWRALTIDLDNKRFTLDVQTERLKDAPGFDKDHWPDMADERWVKSIHTYYGTGASMLSTPPKSLV